VVSPDSGGGIMEKVETTLWVGKIMMKLIQLIYMVFGWNLVLYQVVLFLATLSTYM